MALLTNKCNSNSSSSSSSSNRLNNLHEVIVVGRGVYALPLLRILGLPTAPNVNVKITFATSVGMRDMGSLSRCIDRCVKIQRPDQDLSGFTSDLCKLSRGKSNLIIIPVAEETLYLSMPKVIHRVQQACAPGSVRILTSSHDLLAILHDKFQFQKAMAKIFGKQYIPRTTLVHNEEHLRKSVQACFDKNKGIAKVIIKPLSGHGSIGAHMIEREKFERSTNTLQDLFGSYALPFADDTGTSQAAGCRTLSVPYVVQEFVEGHEYSTLSLCLEGKVVAHVCYQPRQVGTNGFSPIRDLAPSEQQQKTLEYVRRVAASLNLTGHFGFDMIQRFNGDLVAIECNPRLTNGMAFFSPRFSAMVAMKMKMAYLGLWKDSLQKENVVIAPGINFASSGQEVVPRHIMTFLPTLSSLSKAKSSTERSILLEVASISHDDVWWLRDPIPFFSMMVRILFSIFYAMLLQIYPYILNLYDGEQRSISDVVRQFVVDEVVSYNVPTDASLNTQFETIGGLLDGNNRKAANESKGLRVLVTGATGFLGGRIVQVLNQGWDDGSYRGLPDIVKSVTAITGTGRNQEKGQKLMESLDKSTGKETQFIVADLGDPEQVYSLVKDHDVVIHCAALCALWTRWESYFASNVTATQTIAQACQLAGIRLLVHVSSPSVAIAVNTEDRMGIKEMDPLPPDEKQANRYSATKKWAEDIVCDVSRRYCLPCIVLRPRAIFGPGDTTLFPKLLDRLQSGKLAAIGNGKEVFGDFTYVDNVVAACLCCLNKSPSEPKVYSITNDESRKLWNIIETICERKKLEKPWKHIPRIVAYTVAYLIECFCAWALLLFGIEKEPLLTRYTVNVLSRASTFDISAAKNELGYKPIVGFDEGVEKFLKSIDLPSGNDDREVTPLLV